MRYRLLTYVLSPSGEGHTVRAQDFDMFGEALAAFEKSHCTLRCIAFELLRMPGETIERKGWAWADPTFA